MKPVRSKKMYDSFREIHLKRECWYYGCRVWAADAHHVLFGSSGGRDDRFLVPLCRLHHGTGEEGAHGVNAKEYQRIYIRELIKHYPEKREEIKQYKPNLALEMKL